MKTENFAQVLIELDGVFTPATPIEKRDFFAGRAEQVKLVLETAMERGRHAVIYGERGVGKTSLANIINELLPEQLVTRIGVDSTDTYDSMWRKICRRIELSQKQRTVGFIPTQKSFFFPLSDALPIDVKVTPDDVTSIFARFNRHATLIIDEFDRVMDSSTKTLVADTAKAFSDAAIPVTLVIVGVARTVNELIGEHPSTISLSFL